MNEFDNVPQWAKDLMTEIQEVKKQLDNREPKEVEKQEEKKKAPDFTAHVNRLKERGMI